MKTQAHYADGKLVLSGEQFPEFSVPMLEEDADLLIRVIRLAFCEGKQRGAEAMHALATKIMGSCV